MTNTEYEAACVTAAGCFERFEGEHRLKQYDDMIAQVERTLDRLQVERREIINRYNLNKCEHKTWTDLSNGGRRCCECEEVME